MPISSRRTLNWYGGHCVLSSEGQGVVGFEKKKNDAPRSINKHSASTAAEGRLDTSASPPAPVAEREIKRQLSQYPLNKQGKDGWFFQLLTGKESNCSAFPVFGCFIFYPPKRQRSGLPMQDAGPTRGLDDFGTMYGFTDGRRLKSV